MKLCPALVLFACATALITGSARATTIAVYADGDVPTNNGIDASITALGYTPLDLTTAQLDTAGFLASSGASAIYVTREDSSFGGGLDALGVADIQAFVGATGTVAVFTADDDDILPGSTSGDPYDPNLSQLISNALLNATVSGHGYIGEFNGAAEAFSSNSNGFIPLDLIPGNAGVLESFDPSDNVVSVNQSAPNSLINGVPANFNGTESTTYRTTVTGVSGLLTVASYVDGAPAELYNGVIPPTLQNPPPTSVPEPMSLALLLTGLVGLGMVMRTRLS